MKAFTFRLEQALRWRRTQVSLQKSRVAAAAGRLADTQKALGTVRAELSSAASGVTSDPTGGSLGSWAAFKDRSRARIRDYEAQIQVAQRTVNIEMTALVEANRKAQLLENLKQKAQGRWQQDFDRELAAFADEAFLGRLQSESRRARSSGG